MAIDPKYGYINIPNKPDDMPVFVIIGTDVCAPAAIDEYGYAAQDEGATQEFVDAVRARVKEFEAWQGEHKDLVKTPD